MGLKNETNDLFSRINFSNSCIKKIIINKIKKNEIYFINFICDKHILSIY